MRSAQRDQPGQCSLVGPSAIPSLGPPKVVSVAYQFIVDIVLATMGVAAAATSSSACLEAMGY